MPVHQYTEYEEKYSTRRIKICLRCSNKKGDEIALYIKNDYIFDFFFQIFSYPLTLYFFDNQ